MEDGDDVSTGEVLSGVVAVAVHADLGRVAWHHVHDSRARASVSRQPGNFFRSHSLLCDANPQPPTLQTFQPLRIQKGDLRKGTLLPTAATPLQPTANPPPPTCPSLLPPGPSPTLPSARKFSTWCSSAPTTGTCSMSPIIFLVSAV